MSLIIAGHQRSGTTILQQLCNQHPQIGMTNEFANYMKVGQSFDTYTDYMWRRWWSKWRKRSWALISPAKEKTWQTKLNNNQFILRYMWLIYKYRQPTVEISSIDIVLHRLFPETVIVGDKFPRYIYELDKFVEQGELKRLVIYRDARDVVSSTLKKARTDWQGLSFVRKMDTAEKVAHRWIEAIEIMERHQDKLYCLRYENLVCDPETELTNLSNWLGVQPDGFPVNWIRGNSVGKYEKGLTPEELTTILNIAGPTMSRLGYDY